ncbi:MULTISPECIES: hypothetical protein [unclassified Siphonobacter]|uniref:hypothetical protein n=1 Tax=unclassified Siphonobacter TaxID=2635712 RepID=UPI000CBDB24F|nr:MULTISPECIES: hypothetical protein [unclassified Siphonobacter]MDQ1087656.1 hypothetical protein [Siphonobacter sp. SORGH_AS_1065]MDR6193804.1 hypothetical protein [Siphonobacter sp. SORGH_AS_0500]PKK37974.1 hypothetical protein BWI96_02490 [Siphonobacter sp. SORGH_AS_0500]
MKTFGKVLLILAVVTLVVFWILTKINYSEGERAGTITRFSKRGYVFKTWEGELLLGGFSEGTGQMNAEKWQFSVDNGKDSTISTINEALRSGRRVTLFYEEKLFQFDFDGETKFFVTKAEFADGR